MDEIKSFAQGRPQHTDNDDEDDEADDNDVDEIKSFTQGHCNGGFTTKMEVSILIMMMMKKMIMMILMMISNLKIIKLLPK